MYQITWMDLRHCHILPDEGAIVQVLPSDRSRVIRAYVCDGKWYDMGHKEIEGDIRWWRPDRVFNRRGSSVTALQYPRAWALLQEVANEYEEILRRDD